MRHLLAATAVFLATLPALLHAEPEPADLSFNVLDARGNPLPCRIHLLDQQGTPQHTGSQIFWRDHIVTEGPAGFNLAPGRYTYSVEKGPEWETLAASVDLKAGERKVLTLKPARIADMNAQGWYSGDLHIHRPPEQIPLHLRVEELNVAPVITWWNRQNVLAGVEHPDARVQEPVPERFSQLLAGEDEREGGALLFFGLDAALPTAKAKSREVPSPMDYVAEARRRNPGVHIDVEKPFWWDLPVWLASGQVDTLGIAHNHMHHGGVLADEAWGRPRDTVRLPAPLGNGFWTQEIYYHALNAGIRIPPSAGSASGVLPNPIGHNRVYVHLDGRFSWDDWWKGLKAGRTFVTNGPLLDVRADGRLPGHVFRAPVGRPLRIPLTAALVTKERVPAVEIVQDGRVAGRLEPEKGAPAQYNGSVTFTGSGWFLVRAITDNRQSFRFASTAPFYVELGDSPRRVSRASVRFFLDWLDEREARVKKNVPDPADQQEVLKYHARARTFWEAQLAKAEPARIVIIGDSTVCDYPASRAERGWGQLIAERFNAGSVGVINLAASGRSTKTFIQEGRWAKALAERPDYVLIQFGHNDSHAPDRPEATDAATTYREYLRRYVDESRAAGATPVLVTPMVRRTFGPDGRLDDSLQRYADAMKEVAGEKHVALIDLHASSKRLVEQLGPEASMRMANNPTDRTHFNEQGARTMADLVLRDLPSAAPELKNDLKAP